MTVIDVVAQEAGEPGAALPHLAEIILGFLAFAVLVYVVGRFAWPMFTRTHEDHNERVRSGMERAEKEQEDARQELERARSRLAGVDNESARIRDDARADAERIKEDMAARAQDEAGRVEAQGEQSVEASRARAVSELRGEVGTRSVELARRIVAASLSDERRRGESVDGFLDSLEGMVGGTGGSAVASGNGSAPRGNGTATGGGA